MWRDCADVSEAMAVDCCRAVRCAACSLRRIARDEELSLFPARSASSRRHVVVRSKGAHGRFGWTDPTCGCAGFSGSSDQVTVYPLSNRIA